MLARDVEWWRAKVMYAAAYHFGPRWRDPADRTQPPKRTLRQTDFKALAESIRIRETGAGLGAAPPMSLNEIQAWTPQPR